LRERRRQAHEQRWWQNPWLIGAPLGLIAIAAVVYFWIRPSQAATASLPPTAELSQVQYAITHVDPAIYEAVGEGDLPNPFKVMDVNQPKFGGVDPRPQLLYMGAEFCSTCAAQRWSLVAALSRFGEFGTLNPTKSASGESYSELPSFTFYRSQYDSPYVSFVALETADRNRKNLQRPNEDQRSLMAKYTSTNTPAPFISFGNRFYTVGSGYEMRMISDKGWADITGSLNDPTNALTRAIIGNANYLTAGICKLTGNQPDSVCGSAAVSGVRIPG
jgi:hypothetical protein